MSIRMNGCVYNEVPIIHTTNYAPGSVQGDAIRSRQRELEKTLAQNVLGQNN